MDRIKPYQNLPVHETLYIGLCLAFVGGFLDAYTYLLRGGVFANAQTGNLVLFGIHLAGGSFPACFLYLVPVAAFLLGVLITELFKKTFSKKKFITWQHVVVIIEILLLLIIGFLPRAAPDAVINIAVSFVCSMQFNSFRKTNGLPYATTMCTGNLRSAGEFFFAFLFEKDRSAGKKALRYFSVIAVFLLGAALGALLSGVLGTASIWVCCVVLTAVLLMMFFGR